MNSTPATVEFTRNTFLACGSRFLHCITCQTSTLEQCLIRTRCRLQPHPPDARDFFRRPALEAPEAQPLHAGPFGSLTFESPLTGYETNNTLEVIRAEDTPANPTSRRTSFCSTYNSVDAAPATLSSGEIDDPRIGRPASPLLEQTREACVILAGVYHSQIETLHVALTTPKHRENLLRDTQKAELEKGPEKFTGKTARQRQNSS